MTEFEDLVSFKKFILWKIFGNRKCCNGCLYEQATDLIVCRNCYKYDNYLPKPNTYIPDLVLKYQEEAKKDYAKEKMNEINRRR